MSGIVTDFEFWYAKYAKYAGFDRKSWVFDSLNKIEGEFRAATFHDQVITWGSSAGNSPLVPFDNLTLNATCSCKYHIKMVEEKTNHERKYCTHIIGQLRRVIFLN